MKIWLLIILLLGNDLWGWTDPVTGSEIAIMGCTTGTSFVDVTVGSSPIVLGFLPTRTSSSLWRDMKVHNNHAYIVSEAGNHGVQVFDLTTLRDLDGSSIVTLTALTAYTGIGRTHNIAMDEIRGFAFAVGSTTCNGGLHIIDVNNPNEPVCAGCFFSDGYTHDAQCVTYDGPDTDYTNQEICFCFNEDTLTIVDVTNKANMNLIARVEYDGNAYSHQGWATEDYKYLFLNDELDEANGVTGGPSGSNTRTLIWDIQDLDNPQWINSYFHDGVAIDHNLYVKGNLVYETNYCDGLRILEFDDTLPLPSLSEIAFFDVAPECSQTTFNGAWSNYPFFDNNKIIVSSIESGLFILQLNQS